MTVPASLTFYIENGQFLSWYLLNPLSLPVVVPIHGATVTATLYFGRSRFNPDVTPGTPVTGFTNLPLPYITDDPVNGAQYQALIPATFDATPGGGYVCVVDAVASGFQPQHWEIPTVIAARNNQ